MTVYGGLTPTTCPHRVRRVGAVAGIAALVSGLGLIAPAAAMAEGKAELLPPVRATILGTPLKVGDLGLRGAPLAQAVPAPVKKSVRDTAAGVSLNIEPLDTAVAVEEKRDRSARTRPIVGEATVGRGNSQDNPQADPQAPVVGRSENSLGAPRPQAAGGAGNAAPGSDLPGASLEGSDPSVLDYGPREQALAAVEDEWSAVPKYLAVALPLLVATLIAMTILARRRTDPAESVPPTLERRRHAR
ncbi:MAG: hypothetical protein ACT4PP_00360 [Sporichthyaceae bacterium]